MKRMLSILLILGCLLTLLPTTASASRGGKLIALTFDDGPGPYTNRLLDGLAERGVKVTFFVQGMNADVYGNTIRRIYTEGHQLASHTYNHPTLSTQSDSEVRWQVNRTEEILNGKLGKSFHYILRPPYGDYTSRVLSLINTPAIIWSVDPVDWKYRNANTVRDNILSGAFDGAIVLAHDIHSTTVDGALMAIDQLLAQGYEFVTVNELYRRRGRSMTNGELYYSCKPNGTDLGAISAPTITTTAVYGGYQVELTADSGTKIYYTTDGSDPLFYGREYTGAFTLSVGQTIKAVAAYNLNGSRSAVKTQKIEGAAVTEPTIKVENGMVVFENPNADTDLRYTTDFTSPTQSSSAYTAPIACFDGSLTYRVMGVGIATQQKRIYVTQNGNLFWDVPNDTWYFKTVDLAVLNGLFFGTAEYTFSPEDEVTRGMFTAVLARMAKKLGYDVTPQGDMPFQDVASEAYYADAITWAAENELVAGYGDGTFRAEMSITREEMCALLSRMCRFLEQEVDGTPLTFADDAEISAWAKENVADMSAMGIVYGDGNNRFHPQNTATRAEAAAVLLRLYQRLKEES